MPRAPSNDSPESSFRPSSSREIFSPAPQEEDDSSLPSNPIQPTLALPKKRPAILWIGIALLLGGLVALLFVGLAAD